MKFFVNYQRYPYDGYVNATYDTIAEVLEFLNTNAGNPDFTFTVIEGNLVEFEPISIAKAYRRKER